MQSHDLLENCVSVNATCMCAAFWGSLQFGGSSLGVNIGSND
jgi:hypothetical protein